MTNLLFCTSKQPVHADLQYIRKSVEFDVGYRTLLSLKQRQRRYAHIHSFKLQLGEQFDLFHSFCFPRFGYALAADVLFAKRQFS